MVMYVIRKSGTYGYIIDSVSKPEMGDGLVTVVVNESLESACHRSPKFSMPVNLYPPQYILTPLDPISSSLPKPHSSGLRIPRGCRVRDGHARGPKQKWRLLRSSVVHATLSHLWLTVFFSLLFTGKVEGVHTR